MASRCGSAPTDPAKEHYEAQVIGARHVPDATVLALEVGFHSEHPKTQQTTSSTLDALLRELNVGGARPSDPSAVGGPFLGRDSWRRLSETWLDPDLSDPDLAVEVGTRLYEYIAALEPLSGSHENELDFETVAVFEVGDLGAARDRMSLEGQRRPAMVTSALEQLRS